MDEAVNNQAARHRGGGAQVVAAAAPIGEVAFVIAGKIIIFVNAEQVVGFADMVVNNVEDDGQAGRVKGGDQLAKLGDGRAARRIGRVGAGGREIIHRHVAPVVIFRPLVVEFLHGLQLDGIDAEPAQIAVGRTQPLGETLEAAALDRRQFEGRVREQVAHMRLDHDEIVPGRRNEARRGRREFSSVENQTRPGAADCGQRVGIKDAHTGVEQARAVVVVPLDMVIVVMAVEVVRQGRLPAAIVVPGQIHLQGKRAGGIFINAQTHARGARGEEGKNRAVGLGLGAEGPVRGVAEQVVAISDVAGLTPAAVGPDQFRASEQVVRLVHPKIENMEAGSRRLDDIIFVIAGAVAVDYIRRQFLPAAFGGDELEARRVVPETFFLGHAQREISLPVADFTSQLPGGVVQRFLPAIEIPGHENLLILPVEVGIIRRPKDELKVRPVDKAAGAPAIDKGRDLPEQAQRPVARIEAQRRRAGGVGPVARKDGEAAFAGFPKGFEEMAFGHGVNGAEG